MLRTEAENQKKEECDCTNESAFPAHLALSLIGQKAGGPASSNNLKSGIVGTEVALFYFARATPSPTPDYLFANAISLWKPFREAFFWRKEWVGNKSFRSGLAFDALGPLSSRAAP